MINKRYLFKKVALALMVGGAFFLNSCQHGIFPRKMPGYEVSAGRFDQAESFLQRSEFERALESYRLFLEENPGDKKSTLVLHRMSDIYFKLEQYSMALFQLDKISKESPNYPALPSVRYQIAKNFFFLGEYRSSMDKAVKWLDRYPGHTLRGKVLELLGDNSKSLGHNDGAFKWWLKATESFSDDLRGQVKLNMKIEELIKTVEIEELEILSEYGDWNDYSPIIYYRMAEIFLRQGKTEAAQNAALSLIQSATEQRWVSAGRRFLTRIKGDMSMRSVAVGCLLPLSGPFAIYGDEVLNGIQLGMGVFSRQIHGPVVELVIKDSRGDPAQAVKELEVLARNEKVIAVIGPLSSRTALVASEKAQELGVPIITITQKEGIVEKGDMVFRNFMTPSMEIKMLLDTAVDEMGIKRFAILYPENSYGRFFMDLFWDGLEEQGGMVTAVESYSPDDTDFADQIKKLVGLYYPRPDSLIEQIRERRTPEEDESELDLEETEPIIDFEAIFIPDNFQKVAMITPQLVYHDIVDVLLVGTSLWQSSELIEMAGDYVQGAIFSSGFFKESGEPGCESFADKYRVDFESEAGLLAATGFDTIGLLNGIMKDEGMYTRQDLKKALLRCKDYMGVTGMISFDTDGDIEKRPLLLTISGRRIIVYH